MNGLQQIALLLFALGLIFVGGLVCCFIYEATNTGWNYLFLIVTAIAYGVLICGLTEKL